MTTLDATKLFRRLLQEPAESAWLEFKQNNCEPDMIGRCIAACANAAMLEEKDRAYIVFGIENRTKRRVGTTVRLHAKRKGGENLENWLCRMLEPRIVLEFLDFEDSGVPFSIITVTPSYDRPIRFSGTEYIRVGENVKPLRDHPETERALWLATSRQKFEGAVALQHQSSAEVFEKLAIDTLYSLMEEPQPANDVEVIRKLVQLGFAREDMEDGYDITNLGAVLIAKDLTQFPSVAAKSVRVIKYVGMDKRHSEKEVEGKMGYATGFKGLLNFITRSLPMEPVGWLT